MILQALQDAGGTAYLTEQARLNPSAFLTLVGKVLPLQLARAADGAPLTSYVIRAPSPTESVTEWLRVHAPSDARETTIIDAEPAPPHTQPPAAAEPPDEPSTAWFLQHTPRTGGDY